MMSAADFPFRTAKDRDGAPFRSLAFSEQRMYVWEGGHVGLGAVGLHRAAWLPDTLRHVPRAEQNPHGPLPLVEAMDGPIWWGIYWAGSTENGIHSLPIVNGKELGEGYLGRLIAYDCIVVSTEAGELLFNWAEIGTTVVIHE